MAFIFVSNLSDSASSFMQQLQPTYTKQTIKKTGFHRYVSLRRLNYSLSLSQTLSQLLYLEMITICIIVITAQGITSGKKQQNRAKTSLFMYEPKKSLQNREKKREIPAENTKTEIIMKLISVFEQELQQFLSLINIIVPIVMNKIEVKREAMPIN
ncbi:Hypothetical_protein [Hexamita inflata]|uniref:Hypothetical_protein n=1 Tax=Hexamita inflata TaxID=28002 RepID=A0AA86VKW7_9EUKA|nr:Hypothetical protein HINF_LOCUS57243 [Hexamita inflata]